MQGVELGEDDVGLVEDDDLPGLHPRAKLGRACAVVAHSGRVHHHKARQKRAPVQSHMALGRRLAPPVARPVQTVGHQQNRGRVHQMDQTLEAKAVAALAALAEARRERLQMFQRRPKQPPGQLRIARAIGVGKAIAARRLRPADGGQAARDEAQRIAHIVQAQRVSQLRVKQAHHMAPRRENASLLRHARLPGQLRHHVHRNKFTNLAQGGK